MEDIGMSPDYRNGQHELIQCATCQRNMPGWMIDTCAECGESVCLECSYEYGIGISCQECAKKG